MFEFVRSIIDTIFGYNDYDIIIRIFVMLISPVLLPIAFVLDILFGVLYEITALYYDIV